MKAKHVGYIPDFVVYLLRDLKKSKAVDSLEETSPVKLLLPLVPC
jgi:hypothetical protein